MADIKVVVVGETLAPPPMVNLGTGDKTARYKKWLVDTLVSASARASKPRNLIFLKSCCHLAILIREKEIAIHFQRKGIISESSLEKVLKDFIQNNLNELKTIAPHIGVIWPKEKDA